METFRLNSYLKYELKVEAGHYFVSASGTFLGEASIKTDDVKSDFREHEAPT